MLSWSPSQVTHQMVSTDNSPGDISTDGKNQKLLQLGEHSLIATREIEHNLHLQLLSSEDIFRIPSLHQRGTPHYTHFV